MKLVHLGIRCPEPLRDRIDAMISADARRGVYVTRSDIIRRLLTEALGTPSKGGAGGVRAVS